MNCHQCNNPIKTRRSRKTKRPFCSQACYLKHRWDFNATRPGPGLLRCGHCKSVQPENNFYTHGKGMKGGWCRTCRCESERKRRADLNAVHKFHTRYETDMEFRARELLRACAKRCRRYSIPFNLDVEWMAQRLHGRCELTGLEFDMSVRTRKPEVYTPSIDRIVPSLGYVKGNCRLVLYAVNLWMKDFTVEALLPIAEALLSHQGKKRGAA